MHSKIFKFIILIFILVLLGLLLLLQISSDGIKRVKLEKQQSETALLSSSGEITVIDTKTGTIYFYDPGTLKLLKTMQLDFLIDSQYVDVSVNGVDAIVAKTDLATGDLKRFLVNLETGELLKEFDSNWGTLKWIGDSEIYYSYLAKDDLVSGVYIFDTKKNISRPIQVIKGYNSDLFSRLGNYLLYIDASTDASPVTVRIYDTSSKKIIKEFQQDSHSQLLVEGNRAVLIGQNILEIIAGANDIQLNEYSLFAKSSLYTLKNNELFAIEIDPNVAYPRSGKLILGTSASWQSLGLNVKAKKIGYISDIIAINNGLVLITSTGLYRFEFKP